MIRTLLCLALALAAALALAPRVVASEPADWQAERAALDVKFAAALATIAKTCDDNGWKEQADYTREWLLPRVPGRIVLCFDPPAPGPIAKLPVHVQQWTSAMQRARSEHAAAILQLAKRAHDAGAWELGYVYAYEALREDPENAVARRVAGFTPAGKDWLPAQAATLSTNRRPHPKLPGKVTWRIETEHFAIATNDSEAEGRRLAARLEELHAVWRQLFAGYWTNRQALSLAWDGAAPTPRGLKLKHKVVLFRNREEYIEALRPAQAKIDLTEGIYLDTEKTSYFYVGDDRIEATWRHEVTHQLFHEIGANVSPQLGAGANFWVIEGIAMYMESLARREGYAYVGGWDSGRLQFARNWALQGDFYVRFVQFVALDRKTVQGDKNIRQLYSQSAGYAHFLMDSHDGRYRKALVDYLKLVYAARDQANSLSQLTVTDFGALDVEYVEFLRVTDGDLTRTPMLPERRQLCLGKTKVTNAGLQKLPDLKQVDWLDLGDLRINDAGFHSLRSATGLTQLNLEGTAISDDTLETVGAFKNLEELDLSNTAVTDLGVAHLRGLTKLKTLLLNGTAVTAGAREALKKSLPALKE